MLNLIKAYIQSNLIIFSVGLYFIFSVLLKLMTGIDICIPCLWKTFFGFTCPGCGLTRAFGDVLTLNFRRAFQTNWLIFLVIPFGTYYFLQDFKKFTLKLESPE